MPHIHPFAVVMNHADEPVLVSANIEHGKAADLVGMRKASADIGKISPNFMPGRLMPRSQGCLRIWMSPPELPERPLRNHVHARLSSQFAKQSRHSVPSRFP